MTTTSETGAQLLDDIETFLARFVAYPSDHARVAHVLWAAHTHFMSSFESTPRISFLSPEPGSGKSRALEVTEPLVPRPVHAVNCTPAYLFRKVSDPDGLPTLLYDEVDTLFGPKAKDAEDVRAMLNAGHRRGATAGRCVVKGHVVLTEELPAFCPVALAGLNDVPDTIATRSVIVRMRRRAPSEHVEPWRLRIHTTEGAQLRERLERWAAAAADRLTWPDMPATVTDRAADVWEPLLMVADLAGGEWPDRARRAAVALVEAAKTNQGSIGVALLRDLKTVFGDLDRIRTETLLNELHGIDDSPWADWRGKPIDARWLSRHLANYGVKPARWRDAFGTQRGYLAADLRDPWSRYLPSDETSAVSDETPAVSDPCRIVPAQNHAQVSDVSAVSANPGDEGADAPDGSGPSWKTRDKVKNGDLSLSPPLLPAHADTADTPTQPAPCAHCFKPRDHAAVLQADPLCTDCRTAAEVRP